MQEEAVVSKLKVRRRVGTALCGVMHEWVVKCCGRWLWTVREASKFGKKKDKSFAPSFYLQVKALLHSPACSSLLTSHVCFHIHQHRTVIFSVEVNTWPRILSAHAWKVICASDLSSLMWPAIKLKMHVKHFPRMTLRGINCILIFRWWVLWLFAYFTLIPDLHWCFLGHPESFH